MLKNIQEIRIYEYAQIDFKYQQHNKCGNLRRGTRMKISGMNG